MPLGPLAHTAALLLSFALLATVHLSLAWALARKRSWQALAALFPPLAWLAPYWGYREGMKKRALFWGLCFGAYVIVLLGALRV